MLTKTQTHSHIDTHTHIHVTKWVIPEHALNHITEILLQTRPAYAQQHLLPLSLPMYTFQHH